MIRKSPYTKGIMAQTAQPDRATPTAATLPEQEIGRDVLLEKYAKGGEASRAEVRARVAHALAAAEAYHQHYFAQHPNQGYCAAVIGPKVEKFRKVFKERLIA